MVSTDDLGHVTFATPPSWYDAALRAAATVTISLTEIGIGDGLFMTLPASPLYAGETFWVYIFTDSRGYPVNSWRLKLSFDSNALALVRGEVSADFSVPVVTRSSDGASFSSSGLVCGTGCSAEETAAVTGGGIFLMRAQLIVAADAPAGPLAGLGLYAFEVRNYGGGYILEKWDGKALDAPDGPPDPPTPPAHTPFSAHACLPTRHARKHAA